MEDNLTPKRIKALRESAEKTQEQFAQALGVTWKTISRWERGESKPSPLAAQALRNLRRSR